ncbi:hypothetical protein [Mycolicibacterium pallens]|uniref:Uncharacterized protein n=1 Tax=Mycolicibacterium pallens TaxID=370524 RepID=A0ABX8VQV8_9MYCO|nr:hypothetical protein [Mycolicibacterium pallens]QYL20207.1 hypothetical protein K0O64_17360 [Mycolicibacterium pallens]
MANTRFDMVKASELKVGDIIRLDHVHDIQRWGPLATVTAAGEGFIPSIDHKLDFEPYTIGCEQWMDGRGRTFIIPTTPDTEFAREVWLGSGPHPPLGGAPAASAGDAP